MLGGDLGAARGADCSAKIIPYRKGCSASGEIGCRHVKFGLADLISLLSSEFASQALAVDKTFFV